MITLELPLMLLVTPKQENFGSVKADQARLRSWHAASVEAPLFLPCAALSALPLGKDGTASTLHRSNNPAASKTMGKACNHQLNATLRLSKPLVAELRASRLVLKLLLVMPLVMPRLLPWRRDRLSLVL